MRDAKTIIIAVLAIALILSLVSRPKPGPSKEQIEREATYKRQRSLDSLELTRRIAQVEIVVSEHKEYQDSVKVVVNAKDQRIRALSTRLTQQRPQVQPYLDSIPVLKQFTETQDSLIQTQDSTIQVLRDVNYRSLKDIEALSIAIVDERKISEKMLQDCESNREKNKQDLEKAQAKPKAIGWKALGIGSAIVAIWQAAKNAAD